MTPLHALETKAGDPLGPPEMNLLRENGGPKKKLKKVLYIVT
jgi:hypothetical protein